MPGAFFAEDELLRDAAVLDGIPGVFIHGRYDGNGGEPVERLCDQPMKFLSARKRTLPHLE